ncbi:uncharacterized protein LOC119550704 [Drosophila subpulchrella]|nr:uncharacterized protein LOC119550704 [Drosophila subpulchrella]
MSAENRECDDEFERPSRTLVLIIFTLAVCLKLGIILVEIMV